MVLPDYAGINAQFASEGQEFVPHLTLKGHTGTKYG